VRQHVIFFASSLCRSYLNICAFMSCCLPIGWHVPIFRMLHALCGLIRRDPSSFSPYLFPCYDIHTFFPYLLKWLTPPWFTWRIFQSIAPLVPWISIFATESPIYARVLRSSLLHTSRKRGFRPELLSSPCLGPKLM
jgi:hypothetical protein